MSSHSPMPKLKAGNPTFVCCVTACSVHSQIHFIFRSYLHNPLPEDASFHGDKESTRETKGKRPLGWSRGRCDDNIKPCINFMNLVYSGDGFNWYRIGTVMGSCEHRNKCLGFIKREFLDYLWNCNWRRNLLHGVSDFVGMPPRLTSLQTNNNVHICAMRLCLSTCRPPLSKNRFPKYYILLAYHQHIYHRTHSVMHTKFGFHTVQLFPQIPHSKGLSPICSGLCEPNLSFDNRFERVFASMYASMHN
jgi:hypothetical protein